MTIVPFVSLSGIVLLVIILFKRCLVNNILFAAAPFHTFADSIFHRQATLAAIAEFCLQLVSCIHFNIIFCGLFFDIQPLILA